MQASDGRSRPVRTRPMAAGGRQRGNGTDEGPTAVAGGTTNIFCAAFGHSLLTPVPRLQLPSQFALQIGRRQRIRLQQMETGALAGNSAGECPRCCRNLELYAREYQQNVNLEVPGGGESRIPGRLVRRGVLVLPACVLMSVLPGPHGLGKTRSLLDASDPRPETPVTAKPDCRMWRPRSPALPAPGWHGQPV